jgi:hypothetical protein
VARLEEQLPDRLREAARLDARVVRGEPRAILSSVFGGDASNRKQDAAAKRRMAEALGVDVRTVQRWVKPTPGGERRTPRPPMRIRLRMTGRQAIADTLRRTGVLVPAGAFSGDFRFFGEPDYEEARNPLNMSDVAIGGEELGPTLDAYLDGDDETAAAAFMLAFGASYGPGYSEGWIEALDVDLSALEPGPGGA